MSVNHRDTAEQLRSILTAAARGRALRDELVETPDGPELGWVLHERTVMLDAVNKLRAAAGKPAAAMVDIVRAETHASGHVDYAHKFAYGCASLVAAD